MGAIAESLGKNVSAVGVAGNVFDFDGEVLLLAFTDKIFLEVEMFEDFGGCCCFGPVAVFAVIVVDNSG